MRILIVESDPSLAVFLTKSFVEKGHRVNEARSTQELYRLLDQHIRFDLAIVGNSMCGKSGSHLATAIRSLAEYVRLPIVIPASMMDAEKIQHLDAVHLQKPFTHDELYAAMTEAMSKI